ncbi:hypothetical protein OG21DRAFT_1473628 [Imleria badia]|nr:hypothetical protein OG21DRAFT_1473628 [Imleria badia]
MPWPKHVLLQFQIIPPNPVESDFYGAYNKFMYTLFPIDSDFTVLPERVESSKSSFLKDPADLCSDSSRHEADVQLRERLGDLAGDCPISTLHAVSAMGTRLCFYHLDTTNDKADVMPLPVRSARKDDAPPVERWDCDLLDAVGEARLRTVVDWIKAACDRPELQS